MLKVSVLMSNYNTPVEYLKRSIDSVLNQTFTDFELVIVNDGSIDESKDVLYEYAHKDSRVVIIENEHNMGLPRSLNRGLDVCCGEYIMRMDTDDICYKERLEKQVYFMDKNPQLIVSGAWADIFSDDEDDINETWKPVMCSSQDEYHIRLLFSGEPLIIHPSAVFRREMINKYGLRYPTEEKYRYAEDYKMWVDCSKCGDVGILQDVVIKYRNNISEGRITIRHEKEMKKCNQYIQAQELKQLSLELTDDIFDYHFRLLSGRKPYDIEYKKWIDNLVKQNNKLGVYPKKLFEGLLYDRWYTIVYYGIAYEKSYIKRLKYFMELHTKSKVRFAKEIIGRRSKNDK